MPLVVASTQPFTEDDRRKTAEEIFRQVDGSLLNPAESVSLKSERTAAGNLGRR